MKAEGPKNPFHELAEKAARRAALRLVSYILKTQLLCVCTELIEELAGDTDMKFGMRAEDVVTRKPLLRTKRNQTFCHLSQTNF